MPQRPIFEEKGTTKEMRLDEARENEVPWKQWGPYLSERQWGIPKDPNWRDNLLFYEYFHGDNGAGLGASHQTCWTGMPASRRGCLFFLPILCVVPHSFR